MKTLRITLVAVAALMMSLNLGCSKTEDPAAPTNTSTLTPTQQTTYATMAETNSDMAISFAKGFSGGLAGWSPSTSKAAPADAKIDSGWALYGGTHSNHFNPTASSGWYFYNLIYDIDTVGTKDTIVYWVKYTDDVWANPSAVVTRVDWDMNKTETGLVTEYSAFATQQPAATTHSGGWYVGVSASGATVSWEFLWNDVTQSGWDTIPRTCAGSFSYTGYFGLSGNTTFTNGAGSGIAKYNGEQFAKFTYKNDGTGYYTLAADNYVQQYPFDW